MTEIDEAVCSGHGCCSSSSSAPLEILDYEIQRAVLEKLGRVEAKIDMLVGNGQPGRMSLAELRITILERNDIRRSVYERIVNALIAFAVSAAIALHDHLGFK